MAAGSARTGRTWAARVGQKGTPDSRGKEATAKEEGRRKGWS